MKFSDYLKELEKDIQNAHESSPTLEEAEKLAAKFLGAQIQIGSELAKIDLDTRMRKNGLKAVKAAVYLHEASKVLKKPSDVMLSAMVDESDEVTTAQKDFDTFEVRRNELENWLSVTRDGHIYFRGLAKGRFE